MINVAVFESNYLLSGQIDEWFQIIGNKYYIHFVTDFYFTKSLIEKAICSGKDEVYDLICLDVEMTKEKEMFFVSRIRKENKNAIILIISDKFFVNQESLKYQPFLFILKPINKGEFEKIIITIYKEIVNRNLFFEFKYNRNFYKVLLREIIYFESDKKTVFVYTQKTKLKIYGKKLDDIEEIVCKGNLTFLRIHKSILVNYLFVDCITNEKAILSNNICLPISESRYKNLNKQFGYFDVCRLIEI